MSHRDHDRASRIERLRTDIESANELLVPALDLPEDTPETLARRARIQARAADERARQALTVAADVHRDAWTKEQQRAYARVLHVAWERMQRRFYALLITGALVLAVLLVFAWNVWVDQASERRMLEGHLRQLAVAMVVSCETRNDQLRTSEEIYGHVALSLGRDPRNAETVRVLQDAAEDLPEPVDCARYQRIAEGS